MAEIRPFRCIRPNKEVASRVAALPYDVYDRKEAKQEVEANPMSFLAIDRAETQFDDATDAYAPKVYEKAKELLDQWQAEGILTEDKLECYYLYELTMDGRAQTGIVACASIDDYVSGVIARHENTREDKEQDRIRHVDVTDAHTGPIFLAYRADVELNKIVDTMKGTEPLYSFVSEDGISHRVWRIGNAGTINQIQKRFQQIPKVYIADGHHRAASAVKVGLKRREEHPDYTGQEPFNYFLSVLFPDDQLMIMPYNRVVKDLNGCDKETFLKQAASCFEIEERGAGAWQPKQPHQFGMYLDGSWYQLIAKPEYVTADPVKGLDVSILQDHLLGPVLGIQDPRTDRRIQFVGGIRGLGELERLVEEGAAVAFSMYPTSIGELFAVADAGLLMPPKSTWFEPKLRSGLFIHRLSEC
ncbi:MAG: DUF1015 family protein [Lachnospiraceae bacterium]|nr:DUF1015 family protein [Lachnospiraceae bacterium]